MSYLIIDQNVDPSIVKTLLETNFANTALAATFDEDGNFESGILVSTDKKGFQAADLPTPDHEVDNDTHTVAMYSLDSATIFVESGENDTLGIFPPSTELKAYFADWDWGDVDPATGLAEFGLEPDLVRAEDGGTDVRLWVSYCYQAGTRGAPSDDFLRDSNREIVIFDSFEEANKWIEDECEQTYFLRHGEAGRPNYTIVNS